MLQSMGSQRVRHDRATDLNPNLNQHSCLENPMHRGVALATVQGVAESRTQLSD